MSEPRRSNLSVVRRKRASSDAVIGKKIQKRKFIEKTEEVQASTEKTSKIEKSRSVSSFEELKKSCQESA